MTAAREAQRRRAPSAWVMARTGLVVVLAGAAVAQEALVVRLRPDPQLQGPPAVVWVRQQLPRLVPGVHDVRAGLRVQVTAEGVQVHRDDAPLPAGAYLAGSLVGDQGDTLDLRCDEAGFETWRCARAAAERLAVVRNLLADTDVARPRGSTASVEVAVLVGLLSAGIETESPVGLLLTLGAVECATLHVRVSVFGDELVVEGRSRGGLTLPALLLALARRSGPARRDHEQSWDEQRWIALAFAARDGRREEAAMHLARFHSSASERCLRALLLADDGARVRAIESLARRGACDALPAMVACATGDADAAAAATAALASLWPRCADGVRAAARARAGGDPALHAAIARAETAVRHAGVGGAPPRRDVRAGTDTARKVAASLLALSSLALLWRVLRARPFHRIS